MIETYQKIKLNFGNLGKQVISEITHGKGTGDESIRIPQTNSGRKPLLILSHGRDQTASYYPHRPVFVRLNLKTLNSKKMWNTNGKMKIIFPKKKDIWIYPNISRYGTIEEVLRTLKPIRMISHLICASVWTKRMFVYEQFSYSEAYKKE